MLPVPGMLHCLFRLRPHNGYMRLTEIQQSREFPRIPFHPTGDICVLMIPRADKSKIILEQAAHADANTERRIDEEPFNFRNTQREDQKDHE